MVQLMSAFIQIFTVYCTGCAQDGKFHGDLRKQNLELTCRCPVHQNLLQAITIVAKWHSSASYNYRTS